MTVFMKKIRKKFGSAITQYQLIEQNDHILVAVSGGKDSLLMITLLMEMKKKYRFTYEITACHLKNELTEPELRESTALYLENYFKELGVNYIIKELPTVSTSDKDKAVSCFWCSWLRRKTLFDIAKEKGMNKLAFGHHRDDMNETFLINLFYHAKIATMPIKLALFNGSLSIIRPLALMGEDEIKKAVGMMELKVSTCLCPFAGNTKRDYVKGLLNQVEKEFKNIKTSVFAALDYNKIDPTYLN